MAWDVSTLVHPRETRALGVAALVAFAAFVLLAFPVGVGLFFGALFAFTLEPWFRRLVARGWSAKASAFACTAGTTMVAIGTSSLVVMIFVSRGRRLMDALPELLKPDAPWHARADAFLKNTPFASKYHSADLVARLQHDLATFGEQVTNAAARLANATLGVMLALFFMTMTIYFVLLHWRSIVAHATRVLPFEPRHTARLLEKFRAIGRQVLRGTIVTGLVQGVVAAIVYRLAGVTDPVFLGVLTAVASLVPAVGTLLVWIPVGAYLFSIGRPMAATAVWVLSATFVVFVADYFVRPRLVGKEGNVPTLLTFIELFGGVEIFGVIGLVVGPVIMAFALAVLKTYEADVTDAPIP